MSPARVGIDVAVLAGRLGGSVERIEPLAGGASRRTFAVDLRSGRDVHPMVLQVERPGRFAVGPGLEREADLLELLARSGVPVPNVVAAGPDLDGAPWMVTHRRPGTTSASTILRDAAFAPARARLVAQLGELAGRLHEVDPSSVLGPRPSAVEPVDDLAGQLAAFEGAYPALRMGLRWLAANDPVPGVGDVGLCHGDLRLGNLLVRPDGIEALLDLELAGWGPIASDLGWASVRAWRFGGPGSVAGIGGRAELVRAHRQGRSGRSSEAEDLTALRWWQLHGSVRWGVICLVQGFAHLAGLHPSVELAAVGLRVAESEHDVALLLGELGPPDRFVSLPVPIGGSDRGEPTRADLEAVTTTGVAVGVGERERRIVANLRDVLARWDAASADVPPGGADVVPGGERPAADLVAAVDGVDDRDGWSRVLEAVSAYCRSRLEVVNPRYA